MTKIVLDDTAGGYNLQKINANFQKIQTALNEQVLWRNNPNTDPNNLENDLDANGKRIYNLPVPLAEHEAARLVDVQNAISGSNQANLINFSPSGDIVATNVQAAVVEVDEELHSYITNTVEVNVKDLGIVGDGTTDETVAFQTAINNSYGKRLIVPPGCNIKITSQINILRRIVIDFSNRLGGIVIGAPNINAIVIGDGTDPTRNQLFGTQILWPSFNYADGVAQSTSGACIKRNYVAFVDVIGPSFYGKVDGVRKMFRAVHDLRAAECDTSYILAQEMHGDAAVYVEGIAGIANRSVDNNYDFARIYSCDGDGIYLGTDTAGIGVYRPTMFANTGWNIRINATPGPSGQNYFIDTPDIEVPAGGAGGIRLQSGNAAVIQGGWLGATGSGGFLAIGYQIDSAFDTAMINIQTLFATRNIINGPACTINGGNYSGDAVTSGNCFTIGGNDTKIADNVIIRQYVDNGIAWSGNPTGVHIGDLKFKDNGTDIAPIIGWAALFAPIIGRCQTDKTRQYTAAATVNIPRSINTVQITGATAISTIPASGVGSTLMIQAGAGGITLNNSGNFLVKGSPLAIPAFNVIKLECDGVTWFEIGRGF